MIRLLRKGWLALAILICAVAFIPLLLSFVTNTDPSRSFDPHLMALSVYIFMAGMGFALVCIVLILIASATRKRSTRA